MGIKTGEPFHAVLSSTDASTAKTMTITKEGSTTSYTVGATDLLIVTDIIVSSTAGGTISITSTDGTNTITLFAGEMPVTGLFSHQFESPIYGLRGQGITVTADAGQVDIIVQGSVSH